MKNYQRTLILEERNSEQKMEWKFVHIHFSKIQIFHSIVCILLTITSFWMHKNHISTKAQMELALKFVYKTGLLLQKVPKLSASSIRVCCIKCKLKALFPKKKKNSLLTKFRKFCIKSKSPPKFRNFQMTNCTHSPMK